MEGKRKGEGAERRLRGIGMLVEEGRAHGNKFKRVKC